RPHIHGRSIMVDGTKLHIRGATYGTFGSERGSEFPSPERVRDDFASMAAAGINSVRTYVPPPIWLLDLAQEHHLKVMVGLAWEQHVAFLDEPERVASIISRVAE